MTPNAFSAILWLTAAVAAALALYAWRMRRTPSAAALALMLGCLTVWLFGYGAELGVHTQSEMTFWTNVQYPGIALLPAALLIFTVQFAGRSAHVSKLGTALLIAPAGVTLASVWTNDLHRLYYASTSVTRYAGMPQQHLDPGPMYWLYLLYAFTCIFLSVIVLARVHASLPERYSAQARLLMAAIVAPSALAVLRAVGWRPYGELDITTLGFSVTTACVAVLVMKHGFLDVAPIARDAVMAALDHALVVLDDKLGVIEANPSAERLLGLAPSRARARTTADTPQSATAEDILRQWPDLLALCRSEAGGHAEITVERDGIARHLDVTVSTIRDSGGSAVGKIALGRDVTEARASLDAIRAHERVLEAQASASQALLLSDARDSGIDEALEAVGRAMEVHRAYIFENHADPATGAILTSQRYEWAAPGTEAYIDDPLLQNVAFVPEFARWLEALSSGKPIHGDVRDFPPAEREFLRSQGIVSLLVVPIMVDRKLWGFMGLDDCRVSRSWTDADVSSLTVLAGAMGSAVLRHRTVAQLTASESRFRRYFDLPVTGIAICRKDRRIQIANARFGEIVGREPADLVGRDWTELAATTEDAAQASLLHLRSSSGLQLAESRLRRPNGVCVDVEVAAETIEDTTGDIEYMVAIQDISRRKQAEEEYRRITATLNRRVEERTQDLENANKELETFATSVSNDLRAPLRWIEGFTRALSEECGDALDAEGCRYIERIREAAAQMAGRLDALMRLTTASRAELTRVSVDISELAAEIAGELRSAEPGRTVDVRIEPNMRASVSPALFRMALKNLFENAWKFTSQHPAATIEFGMRKGAQTPSGEDVPADAYYIRDNGVGFDPAYAHKLFGAFQRLHSSSEFEGVGMGLAVAQRIIHRHGGEIWAEGAPGSGATFFFTLPDAE